MYKNKDYVDIVRNRLEKEDFNVCYYKNYEETYLNSEQKESLKQVILYGVTTPYDPNVIDFDKFYIYPPSYYCVSSEANVFLIKCCVNNVEGGKTQIFIMEFRGEPIKIKYEKEEVENGGHI
jgi:hypothetical protein